jgi:hypothetical protein
MCLATGANFEFWLDCLVRTNKMSCIMLKVAEKLKPNPYLFVCSLQKNIASMFCLA